ncbi:MAG: hypothetical protein ACEY3D_09600 [Rickettsia sp.]
MLHNTDVIPARHCCVDRKTRSVSYRGLTTVSSLKIVKQHRL